MNTAALYWRRVAALELTDGRALLIGAFAAITVLLVDNLWGIPQ